MRGQPDRAGSQSARVVDGDGRAGAAGAVEGEVNARFERADGPGQARVVVGELWAGEKGISGVGAEHAMLDVVGAEAVAADDVGDTAEEA